MFGVPPPTYSCLCVSSHRKRGLFRLELGWWRRNVTQKHKIMSIIHQVNKKDVSLCLPVGAMETQWSRQVMIKWKIEQVEQSSAVELIATGHCKTSKSCEANPQGTTEHKVNTTGSGGPWAANHWRLSECNRVVSLVTSYTYSTHTFSSWHLL